MSDQTGQNPEDTTQQDGGAGAPPPPETEGDSGEFGDPQKKISFLEEEKNRHWEARKKAEQERDDLAQKVKAIEDRDKTELERTAEKAAQLEKTVEDLQTQLKQARLQNAFLSDNTYQWYDPEDALSLADLTSVEIDEDGKVSNLKKALDDLAKRKPHLVKQESKPDDQAPGTGSASNGRKKNKDELDREALLKKYPALRR